MNAEAELTRYFTEQNAGGIEAAYLFGSFAEGRNHAESDVDVGVLFARAQLPMRMDRQLAAEALSADLIAVLHNNRVDVVVLNDAPPLFARHITTRGHRLFVGSAEVVHAFERDVLLRAADVEPFVQRGRARILEYLRR
jgi:predicted nucleotidyltransferase